MRRTALVMFANWLAQLAYYLNTDDSTPIAFNLLIDTVSAAIILSRPSGRMQAVIGVTYVSQIALHTSYGIAKILWGYSFGAAVLYWEILLWLGVLQLVLGGLWFGDGMARRFLGSGYLRRLLLRGSLAEPHGPPRVGRP